MLRLWDFACKCWPSCLEFLDVFKLAADVGNQLAAIQNITGSMEKGRQELETCEKAVSGWFNAGGWRVLLYEAALCCTSVGNVGSGQH